VYDVAVAIVADQRRWGIGATGQLPGPVRHLPHQVLGVHRSTLQRDGLPAGVIGWVAAEAAAAATNVPRPGSVTIMPRRDHRGRGSRRGQRGRPPSEPYRA
jgi:hypothetical protein